MAFKQGRQGRQDRKRSLKSPTHTSTTIDGKSPSLRRAPLVALIEESVNQLAATGDNEGLVAMLEVIGFHSCVDDDSCDKLAAAIVALAPLLDDAMLGFAANGAVFYRWRESCNWEKANAIAHAAVQRCHRH